MFRVFKKVELNPHLFGYKHCANIDAVLPLFPGDKIEFALYNGDPWQVGSSRHVLKEEVNYDLLMLKFITARSSLDGREYELVVLNQDELPSHPSVEPVDGDIFK